MSGIVSTAGENELIRKVLRKMVMEGESEREREWENDELLPKGSLPEVCFLDMIYGGKGTQVTRKVKMPVLYNCLIRTLGNPHTHRDRDNLQGQREREEGERERKKGREKGRKKKREREREKESIR